MPPQDHLGHMLASSSETFEKEHGGLHVTPLTCFQDLAPSAYVTGRFVTYHDPLASIAHQRRVVGAIEGDHAAEPVAQPWPWRVYKHL